jgi:GTP 3',8-cyclase
MYDRFNRHIHYLRISVTDRCNLRCRYCMPEEGIELMQHEEILTFEEIAEVVRVAVRLGIDKIRFTGGEPLVRKGFTGLVAMIAGIPGIKDLALTTNGLLLKEYAAVLKQAGLQRVNISLDTLNPDAYNQITRGGDIRQVLDGIRSAREVGLEPIKINCVVSGSSEDQDAALIKEFAQRENLKVRFIRRMDLETGDFREVEGGDGGNCSICNRLRLTANGMVKPCLFSNDEFSVRQIGAEEALIRAISHKPRKGYRNSTGKFYNIGG